MPDTSPRLGLPFILPGQAQKHVTHNEALLFLDAAVQLVLTAIDQITPPPTPQEGEIYALGSTPTGDWAGQGGQLAQWQSTGWRFHTPKQGWIGVVRTDTSLRVYTDGDWHLHRPATENLEGLGIATTSDAINRLAVSGEASLLTHSGAGHQLKVNKSASGDSSSLLFQTGWSGRAEVGTIGEDDFSIKVSADGLSWKTALQLDATTGAATFPNGLNGTGSGAGKLGGQVVAFHGEKNGDFTVGRLQSMGNGASSVGAVMPYPGQVVAASMSISAGSPGLNTASMSVNQIEQISHQVSVTYSGSGQDTGYVDFQAAALNFAAGDALNMMANTSSGAKNVVTTFFVVFD